MDHRANCNAIVHRDHHTRKSPGSRRGSSCQPTGAVVSGARDVPVCLSSIPSRSMMTPATSRSSRSSVRTIPFCCHDAPPAMGRGEGSDGKRTPRESGALPRPVDADPNDDVGVSADRKGYVAVSEVLASNMKQLMVNIG